MESPDRSHHIQTLIITVESLRRKHAAVRVTHHHDNFRLLVTIEIDQLHPFNPAFLRAFQTTQIVGRSLIRLFRRAIDPQRVTPRFDAAFACHRNPAIRQRLLQFDRFLGHRNTCHHHRTHHQHGHFHYPPISF